MAVQRHHENNKVDVKDGDFDDDLHDFDDDLHDGDDGGVFQNMQTTLVAQKHSERLRK